MASMSRTHSIPSASRGMSLLNASNDDDDGELFFLLILTGQIFAFLTFIDATDIITKIDIEKRIDEWIALEWKVKRERE